MTSQYFTPLFWIQNAAQAKAHSTSLQSLHWNWQDYNPDKVSMVRDSVDAVIWYGSKENFLFCRRKCDFGAIYRGRYFILYRI